MIVTIEGKEGEGKSLLANKICGDLRRINIPVNFFYGCFVFLGVDVDTQVIVVDDIKATDFKRVYYSF